MHRQADIQPEIYDSVSPQCHDANRLHSGAQRTSLSREALKERALSALGEHAKFPRLLLSTSTRWFSLVIDGFTQREMREGRGGADDSLELRGTKG